MTENIFRQQQKVLFKHCDPAGIMFYPRYFEIINDCVEAFFDAIGHAFEDLHKSASVPTAKIETEFLRPSRHGDMLDLALHCTRVGRASAGFSIVATCAGETRLTFRSVIVHIALDGAPTPWPDDLRAAITAYRADAG